MSDGTGSPLPLKLQARTINTLQSLRKPLSKLPSPGVFHSLHAALADAHGLWSDDAVPDHANKQLDERRARVAAWETGLDELRKALEHRIEDWRGALSACSAELDKLDELAAGPGHAAAAAANADGAAAIRAHIDQLAQQLQKVSASAEALRERAQLDPHAREFTKVQAEFERHHVEAKRHLAEFEHQAEGAAQLRAVAELQQLTKLQKDLYKDLPSEINRLLKVAKHCKVLQSKGMPAGLGAPASYANMVAACNELQSKRTDLANYVSRRIRAIRRCQGGQPAGASATPSYHAATQHPAAQRPAQHTAPHTAQTPASQPRKRQHAQGAHRHIEAVSLTSCGRHWLAHDTFSNKDWRAAKTHVAGGADQHP